MGLVLAFIAGVLVGAVAMRFKKEADAKPKGGGGPGEPDDPNGGP